MSISASIIVITCARPDYVRSCLKHLSALTTRPREIIVVDASPDDRTIRLVTDDFPTVRLVRNELGRGTMPESRQIGLSASSGDVVAFIDDDAFADPEWLGQLLEPFEDPAVVGVGGRVLNGIDGEETTGLADIGRLLPDGRLTGNFAADPGRVIEVDHLIGANMSFRRSSLTRIGGIRGSYPGTCLREDSDISLRLKNAGGTLIYQPRAIVRHVAAPCTSARKRFDRRYLYYSRRNHVMLLLRVFGPRHPILRRYVRSVLQDQHSYIYLVRTRLKPRFADGRRRPLAKRLAAPLVLTRSLAHLSGLVAGFPAGLLGIRRDKAAGQASPDGASNALGHIVGAMTDAPDAIREAA